MEIRKDWEAMWNIHRMIETEFLWLTVNLHFGVVPGKSSIFQERRDGEHEDNLWML